MKKYDNSWEEYANNVLNESNRDRDRELLTNNSLIESLKESIKNNVKSLKFNSKDKLNSNNNSLSMHKTEKEKLKEHYNNIKSSSKPVKINDDLNSNEFVIFDTFRNMLKKGKNSQRTEEKNYNFNTNTNNTNSLSVSISSAMESVNLNNNLNLYLSHNQNNIYTMTASPIKSNPNASFANDRFDYKNNDNIQIETLNFQITNNEDTNKNTTVKTEENFTTSKKNCNCLLYKKKYQKFKKLYETNKRNFIREKKNSEFLSLKFLYEKYENQNSKNENTNISNKSTELMTKFEDEVKVSKMLLDKLQENNLLFEKLENEIYNKGLIINKQNETIKHQKQTIDKLLEQFKTFLNQGNYLTNDILILKQNIYEKNFKEVTKEFDVISNNINEYTSRIKSFSERAKDIIDEKQAMNTKLNTIDEVNAEPSNNEILQNDKDNIIFNEKSDFYIQTNEDNSHFSENLIENESGLFSLTRSNIRNSINKNDKSLNIFELSN